jgi:predicted adenine nucleotide alpha hydrolase (AANH) superfamily ATPase
MGKPKMLVHICCAPDALYVMGLLREEYEVSGYFYNPNIHPHEEYEARKEETKKVARILGFDLIDAPYEEALWHELTVKFKDEPEKGRRCDICYAMRLSRTAHAAAGMDFDSFTTVMSLSPWKKAGTMNKMGKMFGRRYGIEFLEANFKKQEGFKKSVLLSRDHRLHRQDYCGCVYSMNRRKQKDQGQRQHKNREHKNWGQKNWGQDIQVPIKNWGQDIQVPIQQVPIQKKQKQKSESRRGIEKNPPRQKPGKLP